jgi:hypothetical protein
MLKSYLKLHDATVNHRQCDEFYYTLVDKAEGLPYRSQIRVELHEILSDSPIYHSINKRNYENEDLELFFMKANGKALKMKLSIWNLIIFIRGRIIIYYYLKPLLL